MGVDNRLEYESHSKTIPSSRWWTHPFVMVPSVVALPIIPGVVCIILIEDETMGAIIGWSIIVSLSLLPGLVCAIFILYIRVTVWPCCRDEGTKGAGSPLTRNMKRICYVCRRKKSKKSDLNSNDYVIDGVEVLTKGDIEIEIDAGVEICKQTPFHVDILHLHVVGSGETGEREQKPADSDAPILSQISRIGMSRAPGRKRKGDLRELGRDLADLRTSYGPAARCRRFSVIVTLMEPRELQIMECEDMKQQVESLGMQWIHFPIRDKWLPYDTTAFLRLVDKVARLVSEGRSILVHCNGGKGRTGLVATAVLMSRTYTDIAVSSMETNISSGRKRMSFKEALSLIRKCRPGMLKNPLQQLYMHHLYPVLEYV